MDVMIMTVSSIAMEAIPHKGPSNNETDSLISSRIPALTRDQGPPMAITPYEFSIGVQCQSFTS